MKRMSVFKAIQEIIKRDDLEMKNSTVRIIGDQNPIKSSTIDVYQHSNFIGRIGWVEDKTGKVVSQAVPKTIISLLHQ